MSLFTVDPEKCMRDGICVAVCPLDVLEMTDKDDTPSIKCGAEQRCVTCGHCVAVCPHGAIAHQNMAPEDCLPLRKGLRLSPTQAEHFLMSRRSIRVYEDKPVPRETLNKLMRMTSYAPAAHNKQFTSYPPINEALHLPEGNINCGVIMIGYPKFEYLRIPLRNEPMIIWR